MNKIYEPVLLLFIDMNKYTEILTKEKTILSMEMFLSLAKLYLDLHLQLIRNIFSCHAKLKQYDKI